MTNPGQRDSVEGTDGTHAGVTAADELFAALDGRIVVDGDALRVVRVWGIHGHNGRLWLQMGFQGREALAGTIPVNPGCAEEALRDFIAWWRSAADRTRSLRPLPSA